MRLLQFFNYYLAAGGEEKSPGRVQELMKGQIEIENCFFYSADWKGPGAPKYWQQALWTLYNPHSIAKVRKMQAELRADAWVVHNLFPVGSAGIYREALRQKIPVIYFIHNFRPYSVNATLWVDGRVNPAALRGNVWPEVWHGTWQDSFAKSAVLAIALQTAFKLGWFKAIKAWVANSDFMRQKFIEAGVPAEAIFTLRYAYQCRPSAPPAIEDDFYFFIGRLAEQKGVGTLLQAWTQLAGQMGTSTPRLLLAGDGPMRADCEQAAAANDRILYLGRISDERKAELLATCRAVLAPSVWWEPLNIVPYEAYDYAKPMVAAASGGLAETVTDGETGFLHPPGDARGLAQAIMQMERDPVRRRQMGQNGRAWVVRNTDEDKWRTEFSKVVEFAVRSVKPGRATPTSAPTRILSVFNKYLERGGEEVVVEQINGTLNANPQLFTHRALLFESAEWMLPPVPPVWKKALWFMHNPKSVALLRKAHEAIHADCWLTHNIFPVGSAAIYREAARLRVPVIKYMHNFRPFSVNGYLWDGERIAAGGLRRSYWQEIRAGAWQNSRIRTAGFALALHAMHHLGWWNSVRAWIAISEFMRERLIEAGIPADQIFTLRNFYRPQPLVPTASRSERYVLFLGRMIAAKGVRVLLEVWSRLEARFGEDVPELRLAGDGPLSAWVAGEAKRHRRVRYLGRIDGAEKAAQLTGCLALVAPSVWWEPLGQVIYEAFDYAKPVLAARSGGMTELISDGITGCLHEPGAVDQLADQVMNLDAEPAQAAEMGRRGRDWLEANTRVEDWLKGFCQIVARATGRPGT